MVSDYIDEELKIMEELNSGEQELPLSAAINIHDPIKTLNLDYIHFIDADASLFEAMQFMAEQNKGCITIQDENKKICGIFTERDILRRVMLRTELDTKQAKIKDFMTKNPKTLDENDPIAFALNRMSDGSYRHIPITRNGSPRFMLSIKDIVDQISITYRDKVLNLPPSLKYESSSQYGG
jgi:signal-transduction protein with cAMP-binding, CBS, and nucleotidyltransferase domain